MISRNRHAVRLTILLAILAPSLAAAQVQTARRRPGFWVGAGVGGAVGQTDCTGCEDSWNLAPSGIMAVGTSFNPSLGVSIEVAGSRRVIDGVSDHFGLITGNVFLYPWESGLFFTAGMGVARNGSDIDRAGAGAERDVLASYGFAWKAGVGYEIPLSPTVSIAPAATYLSGSPAELSSEGRPLGLEAGHHAIQLAVGLYWNFSVSEVMPPPRR